MGERQEKRRKGRESEEEAGRENEGKARRGAVKAGKKRDRRTGQAAENGCLI